VGGCLVWTAICSANSRLPPLAFPYQREKTLNQFRAIAIPPGEAFQEGRAAGGDIVAIVGGASFGLGQTSAKTPGARGVLGNPSAGYLGSNFLVNAWTGNLIIQGQDEAYNAQNHLRFSISPEGQVTEYVSNTTAG
jgi:hypothetical protein